MGEVFLARDIRLDRTVALKVLYVTDAADTSRLERFATEAKAASCLNHPNVASVYGIGQCGPVCYIAMEHIKGKTLKQLQLNLEEVREVAIQAASALEAAHAAGIIHRDIKPANIMRTDSGLVKVLDFGLAKRLTFEGGGAAGPGLTQAGMVMGTLGYMSPEQLLGREMDPRTDIFSLGVVFYELLTGKLPFASDSYQNALSEVVGSTAAPASRQTGQHLPAALAPIVLRCIERDPDRRFQSVTELIAALRTANTASQILEPAIAPPAVVVQGKSRRQWLFAGGATAVLAGFAGAAWKLDLFEKIPSGPLNSLAVLPFASGAGGADLEYLREGIAESLMNRLSAVAGLRVISRDSAFRLRGQEAVTAGRKLAVRGVVTGAIHRLDGALLVTAELIDSATGDRIWGDEFRGGESDVLAVRDRIAKAIALKLSGQLQGGKPSGSEQPQPEELRETASENPQAHDLYLRGRYHTSRIDAEELRRGLDYFEQAARLDPNYALVHAATAEAHILAADLFLPSKDALPLARDSARKALECAPTLAEGHMSNAMVTMVGDLDWPKAEAGFRKAIELRPNLAVSHSWLGWLLSATGRTAEGLASNRRAVDLEPRSPIAHATLAANLYFSGNYADSFQSAGAALEIDPQYPLALLWRAMSMIARGLPSIVVGRLESVKKTNSSPVLSAALGRAYASSGQPAKARVMLQELTEAAGKQHVSMILFAGLHAALGDKAQAIAALEKAFETRSKLLLWTGRDPIYQTLHNEPGFREVLRKMNLQVVV
jgi:TolB-like protein